MDLDRIDAEYLSYYLKESECFVLCAEGEETNTNAKLNDHPMHMYISL